MSLVSRLYELQATELELRNKRRLLQDTVVRLNHNPELSAAEEELAAIESRLDNARKHQRRLDWEVEDLNVRIRGLNDKLYGGSVRNPKELVSLEQDVQSVRRYLEGKEEKLLEAMDVVESVEAEAATMRHRVASLRDSWEQERPGLETLRGTVEAEVSRLTEACLTVRNDLGAEAAQQYDQIARARGVAVVKVEQGRCKGCNLTLPTGLWQRARAGETVECGSCGRLLYVE